MKKAIIHYAGYLLSAIGAVVGVSLLSHHVSPSDYGRVALYVSLGTLFQYIVRESLGAAILRYTAQINQEKSVCLYLVRHAADRLGVIFMLVMAFAYVYMSTADPDEFLVSMVFILLLGLSVIGETFLSATGRRLACSLHVNLLQWLRFLFALLLFLFWQPTVLAIMLGFVLGFLVVVFYDIAVYRHIQPQAAGVSLPVLPANLFAGYTTLAIGFLLWFLTFYERIALEWFYGEAYLGAYFLLFQIGFMPVYMVMRSAVNHVYPLLFATGSADLRHLNTRNVLILATVILLAFLLLQLSHEWLFGWLVGESYRQYSWLLPWLFLAALLNAVSYLLQAFYYEAHAIKRLLRIKMIAALAAFFITTVCVWAADITGLVVAGLLVSILQIVLSWHFLLSRLSVSS